MNIGKILLIDDNNATNYYNSHFLAKNGFKGEVRIATNGKKGLQLLDDWLPDLIFLDINMPVMNGLEFLERFEKLPIQLQEEVTIVVMIGVDLTEALTVRLKQIKNAHTMKGKMLTREHLSKYNIPERVLNP